MSTTALAGTNSNWYRFTDIIGNKNTQKNDDNTSIWKFPAGCDLPEDGGIGGNLGREDKPIPGACEERPTTIDPETGERVYVDVYRQSDPYICYEA